MTSCGSIEDQIYTLIRSRVQDLMPTDTVLFIIEPESDEIMLFSVRTGYPQVELGRVEITWDMEVIYHVS